MNKLMFRIQRGAELSDRVAQQYGYKDWVDCNANEYDKAQMILKIVDQQVKKELEAAE
jgi:succinate dehydrogenase flavin-adding protein (antitoxin of CptAB toxin-antitoxin module)